MAPFTPVLILAVPASFDTGRAPTATKTISADTEKFFEPLTVIPCPFFSMKSKIEPKCGLRIPNMQFPNKQFPGI
jgi:hypothetical protein